MLLSFMHKGKQGRADGKGHELFISNDDNKTLA